MNNENANIRIKRGNKSDMPILDHGEMGWCDDSEELYIGGVENENVKLFENPYKHGLEVRYKKYVGNKCTVIGDVMYGDITDAGKTLLGKIANSNGVMQLKISKVVIGDGSGISHTLALGNVELDKVRGKVSFDGKLELSSVKQGFFWRECGLYAMDPQLGETLYNYAYYTKPDYIAASDSGMMEEILVSMVATVGSNTNVDVTIDNSMVMTTKKEFDPLKSKVDDICISVKEFGATGDGVTDDTQAIRNAINASNKIFIPQGSYLITSQIDIIGKSSLEITGTKDSEIVLARNIIAFNISDSENITLNTLKVDCSSQQGCSHPTNVFVKGSNLQNVDIKHIELKNGSMGITMSNINNYVLSNCLAYGFSGWPFTCSYAENVKLIQNTAYNGAYDGLKMSGTIKDVIVNNNLCYNNTRDGFDFAGHSCEGLKIFGNIFRDNMLEGVEIKMLNRETYPIPPEISLNTLVFKDVDVHDNSLYRNGNFGIAMDNSYGIGIQPKNILLKNNHILGFDAFEFQKYAVRVAGFQCVNKDDFLIINNDILGAFEKAIRIMKCTFISIRSNIIKSHRIGIECGLESSPESGICSNIYIENNRIISIDASCIFLRAEISNSFVQGNECSSPSKEYRVHDYGTGNTLSSNVVVERKTAKPYMRGTQGDIVYSSDVLTSGCIGWVATGKASDSSIWKAFGMLEQAQV